MSNLVKTLLVIGVVAALVPASLVVYTLPHWWWRAGSVKAFNQQGEVADFAIFKSIRGELLLVDPGSGGLNIVYPSSDEIGIPSSGQVHFFRIVAFANEAPIPVVLSSDKIKVENGMRIFANGAQIEFTTLGADRLRIDRSAY